MMRLQIDLLARGQDLKEAIAKIKERREAASKKLTELGAAADSIQFGEVRIVPSKNDEQRRMEMMVRARMKGQKPGAKDVAKKEPVKVSMSLKAEWLIKAGSAEERLLAAHELQDKIREADLAGQKEAEKLSAEEQEEAEEAAGEERMPSFDPSDGAAPGTAVFFFVAKVSDEEKSKMAKEAFDKARASAERLAKAAGVGLGPLQSLSRSGQGPETEDFSGEYNPYRSAMYPMLQRLRMEQGDDAAEAVGTDPGQVSLRVTVTAEFAVK
jgi:uncharacterized protein YggE